MPLSTRSASKAKRNAEVKLKVQKTSTHSDGELGSKQPEVIGKDTTPSSHHPTEAIDKETTPSSIHPTNKDPILETDAEMITRIQSVPTPNRTKATFERQLKGYTTPRTTSNLNIVKRGRGRPKGSRNIRNKSCTPAKTRRISDTQDYYPCRQPQRNLELEVMRREEDDITPPHAPTATALDLVYGDHIHNNCGSHLSGGISDDKLWRVRWNILLTLPLKQYRIPTGSVGKEFLDILTSELQGVLERRCNFERPLLFIATMLQRAKGLKGNSNVRIKLNQRMAEWKKGNHGTVWLPLFCTLSLRRLDSFLLLFRMDSEPTGLIF